MFFSSETKLSATPVDLRTRILGGAVQPLGQLNEEELIVMCAMLARGEAEVVSSANQPYLISKLN